MSEWVPTTCMRCAVGCGHLQRGVDIGYGLDVVRGDANHPVNRGLACRRGVRETADPGGTWLTRPLVRRGGELVRTTWDVALAAAVEGLGEAANENPNSVAVLGSGQQTNEAAYLLGKVARGGIGTRYYDANTTLCMASAVTAYYDAFGSDAPPPTYDDVDDADVHVVWGANPSVAHPVFFRWVVDAASGGSAADPRLIVVDPVESETVDDADAHVRPAPGGDLALARAVLARLLETDGIDREFVESHTEGFDALCEDLPTPGECAEVAGVTTDAVDLLADAFRKNALVYWGMGVNQSTRGTETAGALIDCCLATGNLKPGSGPFSLTGQANSMGTRVCSSKGTWPGHRPFDDPESREEVAEAWGVPEDRLPDDPGPGPVGIARAMADGEVEACWAVATNPAAGLPDASEAREGLSETFLVVQDAFRTETVELADVVLPAATWGESSGTAINMERRVSRVRAATDIPPAVRTDLDTIALIGERIAPGLVEHPPVDPEGVFDELRGLTAGTPADLSGITYDRLDAELAVRWPAPTPTSEGDYRYYERTGGRERWSFPTPSGRARFSSVAAGAVEGSDGLPEPVDDAYPLTLTTAREPDGYNTGVRTRGDDETAAPVARINPETLDSRSEAVDRGTATLASRRASITVRIQPDDRIPRELVWLPIHHPSVNDLTPPDVDPRSKEPNYKQCAVALSAPEPTNPLVSDELAPTTD